MKTNFRTRIARLEAKAASVAPGWELTRADATQAISELRVWHADMAERWAADDEFRARWAASLDESIGRLVRMREAARA